MKYALVTGVDWRSVREGFVISEGGTNINMRTHRSIEGGLYDNSDDAKSDAMSLMVDLYLELKGTASGEEFASVINLDELDEFYRRDIEEDRYVELGLESLEESEVFTLMFDKKGMLLMVKGNKDGGEQSWAGYR